MSPYYIYYTKKRCRTCTCDVLCKNKLKQEECGTSVKLLGNQTKFINWNCYWRKRLWKTLNSVKTCQNNKNALRVTLIIYFWVKCLIFLCFRLELFKNLESDGQEIKISTRMKKFYFYVKYDVFSENESEILKNSYFSYTWSNDHIQCVVQISERSNQYSRRYGILKSYPIGIRLFCNEMIEKNVNLIGHDFKMSYLLEYY